MQIQKKLNAAVEKWNLLKNPFYEAWSAGKLPKAALQMYASEYSHFLGLLPMGWSTLNDSKTAQEECKHMNLWEDFTKSLETDVVPAQLSATQRLATLAKKLFAQTDTALGALYAFEVQQPQTAVSKLSGLRKHYAHFNANEKYFEAHSHNEHESTKLLKMIDKLSDAEKENVYKACNEMSKALWDTLLAIHEQTCVKM